MIRPFTFVTLMLACSSGAYLFVVKHRAAGLDDQISGVTGQIRTAEQRIRVLQAEWAQENDPNRLADLADRFTSLKPMAPNQMTTLAGLADSLPAPGAEMPHLPLPPPPPWAKPALPAPSTAAGGPIASAEQIKPASTLSSGALTGRGAVVTETALLSPPLPAPKPIKAKPVQVAAHNPIHHPVRHTGSNRAGFQYAASSPAGIPMTAATANPAQTRMAPRYAAALPYHNLTPVQPYRYQREVPSYRAASRPSVFGSLGADLPPPQPVYRNPR